MKRTEVITVLWKTVPHIYNTTCKEMFPNIDAAMIYVQFIWMTTSRRICVKRDEIALASVLPQVVQLSTKAAQ